MVGALTNPGIVRVLAGGDEVQCAAQKGADDELTSVECAVEILGCEGLYARLERDWQSRPVLGLESADRLDGLDQRCLDALE